MVSHIVGGAFGIAVLVLCIVFGAVRGNGFGMDQNYLWCFNDSFVYDEQAFIMVVTKY